MGTKGKDERILIGIVPSFDEGNNIPAGGDVKRIYLRHEYTDLLARVGVVPIILNPDMPVHVITELCHGIVISGGEDIEPHLYGVDPLPSTRFNEPKARFIWELDLIEACDASQTPILGICYGMQRLNVHYGGTLIQDLPTVRPDNIGHDMTEHDVTFTESFLNMSGVRRVASRHHQAIDRLAEGFSVVARADDDVVEAIIGHGHFGMQWHPESDTTGIHAYEAFVNHCVATRA